MKVWFSFIMEASVWIILIRLLLDIRDGGHTSLWIICLPVWLLIGTVGGMAIYYFGRNIVKGYRDAMDRHRREKMEMDE